MRERDGVELDETLDLVQFACAGPFDHLGRRVEQLGDARPGHPCRRQSAVQSHQRLHRRDDARLIRHERRQRAERHRALDHAPAAVDEDGGRARREQQRRQAAAEIVHPLQPHQRADERVVEVREPLHLTRLRVRRDDRPHALQRLDQEAADVRAPLADVADARLDAPPVLHERPRRGRQRRQTGDEEPPIEPDQNRHGAGEKEHVADPGERRLRRDPLDLADVIVDARDDVAEPRACVEPRRQPLQVFVEVAPHVEQDVRRDTRVLQSADDGQHESGGAGRDEHEHDALQRAEVTARPAHRQRATWSGRAATARARC